MAGISSSEQKAIFVKKVLDLGCGNRKRAGAIGIDIIPNPGVDVVHDLDRYPYPFDTSTFDEIFADNVLEHLESIIKAVEELHRITKPGGLIKVIVPYFRAKWAFIDPTHKHFFTTESFTYFEPGHPHSKLYNYSPARLAVEKIVFNETIRRSMITTAVKAIANAWPQRYERFLGHLYPLDELTFYLRVIK